LIIIDESTTRDGGANGLSPSRRIDYERLSRD
jgi:hypothetical protein